MYNSGSIMGDQDSTEYTVQAGDCLFSIAEHHGYHWETIWKDPANAALRQLRKTPAVIMARDIVTLPAKKLKELSRATDQTHKFVRSGTPAKLRLQFLNHGEPRKNQPYTLDLDGVTRSGTTDGEGFLTEYLPSKARQGLLILGQGDDQITYPLELGHLDPVDSDSGIAHRLTNLGFLPANADPSDPDAVADALRHFQTNQNLPVTGHADPGTTNKIKELHGS